MHRRDERFHFRIQGYLEICGKLEYNLKNSFVLYPKDLQKSHDKAAKRINHKHDAKMKRDFIAVYRQLSGKLDFEKNGFKIVYPHTPDDVAAEGNSLHHCAGSYTECAANGKCIILFLRQCSDESKPFYTIEVKEQEAVQVRGAGNCGMILSVSSK